MVARRRLVEKIYRVLALLAAGTLIAMLVIGTNKHGVLWLAAVIGIYAGLAVTAALGLWAWERFGGHDA